MAIPIRSDGQQFYKNLSGYTGEATPDTVNIDGAEFQKQTEATKAGLDYEKAKKKLAKYEKRYEKNKKLARTQDLSYGKSQRARRRAQKRDPGSDIATGRQRAQTKYGKFGSGYRSRRELKFKQKMNQPIEVGFGKNKQTVDVKAIESDPQLQAGYRKAAQQGKEIKSNNLQQGAELAVRTGAKLVPGGTVPGLLLNAGVAGIDAGFKGEDPTKAMFSTAAKDFIGGEASPLFDQAVQKGYSNILMNRAQKQVGAPAMTGLFNALNATPGVGGSIASLGGVPMQQASLQIAGQKFLPSEIGSVLVNAGERAFGGQDAFQNPQGQYGNAFVQPQALPTGTSAQTYSTTNPSVAGPYGPVYQPFNPNSALQNQP